MEFFFGGEKSPLIMEEFKALNAGAASERSGCQKQMDAAPAFDHSLRKPPQKTRKGGGGIRTPHLQQHAASHNFSCSPPPRSGINRTSQEAGAAACRCRMRSVLEEGALAPPRRRCCTSWKCLPIPFGCFLSFLPLLSMPHGCPSSLCPCSHTLWLAKAEPPRQPVACRRR